MKNKTGGYHKLIIWKKGKEFIRLVYEKTEKFPRSEVFGLRSQLRRATLSFLLNIVEGQRRSSRKEFLRFLDISDSSLAETEACLEIALSLDLLPKSDFGELEEKRRELAVMLRSLIRGIKKI